MDVTFTEEQQALRAAVADLLGDHADPRAVAETDSGSDLDLYDRLVALGAADLPGMVELGVVLEECGRWLAPAPVVSVLGIAAPALAAAGEPAAALLAATRTGAARPVVALQPGEARLIRIPEAHVATHILFAEDGELVSVEAGEARIHVHPTMDATRRLCDVEIADTAERARLGEAVPALAAAHRWGAVAIAHELVGVAQATLDLAVGHARGREQFGRPIGSFQAISQRCADMFVAVEAARSHAYFAAWAVDAAQGADSPMSSREANLAASQAKAAASEAAVANAQGCIQVHGGIGFTWEHDAHRYLKRARGGAALLGTAAEHRRRIADLLDV